MKSLHDTFTMRNGVGIPCVGLGTFLISDGEDTYNAVLEALRVGYRHIDTAAYYGNEKSIGQAVRDSGIPREEIFITSKVWNADQGYETTLHALDRTLTNLGMDYLDLYLIHWPRVKGREDQWIMLNRQTWQAMERKYEDGAIRSIGVSNFKPHHVVSLMETSLTIPMVNQIEIHPGLNQQETVEFCQMNNIVVEAWGPFSRGALFDSDILDPIASRHGKTPAQICLRWHLQRGILPLPKTVTPQRMVENADIFDFHLTEEEMEAIWQMPEIGGTGMDPDKAAH